MSIVVACACAIALSTGLFRIARRFYSPARILCLAVAAGLGWGILLRAQSLSPIPRMAITNMVLLGWVLVVGDAMSARSDDDV